MSQAPTTIHCMDARQQIASLLRESFELSGKKNKAIGLEIGRSESSISRYATGQTLPSRAVIKRLARAGYLSDSVLSKLKDLAEEAKEVDDDLTPASALKARFQALEARNEALEAQLLALRDAFDTHTHT